MEEIEAKSKELGGMVTLSYIKRCDVRKVSAYLLKYTHLQYISNNLNLLSVFLQGKKTTPLLDFLKNKQVNVGSTAFCQVSFCLLCSIVR